MTLEQWRDRFVEELRRQGLPSKRVNRLVEELTDHALDLVAEHESMVADTNLESRLGSPEQLAMAAREDFNRSRFAGRHPLLTFVGGPIAMITGILFGTTFLVCLITWCASLISGQESVQNPIASLDDAIVAYRICEGVSLFFRFVPFAVSIWVFVGLGHRVGKRSWSFGACVVIALSAICLRSRATLQTRPDNRVFIIVDWFTIPDINSTQIIQAVVPLAFGAWLYWRSSGNSRSVLPVQ